MQKFSWDWDSALGDTIKERVESLYVFMICEVLPVVEDELSHGKTFVFASPEIASLFEISSSCCYTNQVFDLDLIEVRPPFLIGKFRLFKTAKIPPEVAYIFGAKCTAKLQIANYTI